MKNLLLSLLITLSSLAAFADCDLFQSELAILREQSKDLSKTMSEAYSLSQKAGKEKSETTNEKLMRLLSKAKKQAGIINHTLSQIELHKDCACDGFNFDLLNKKIIEVKYFIKRAQGVDLVKHKKDQYAALESNSLTANNKAIEIESYLVKPCSGGALAPVVEEPAKDTTPPDPEPIVEDTTPATPAVVAPIVAVEDTVEEVAEAIVMDTVRTTTVPEPEPEPEPEPTPEPAPEPTPEPTPPPVAVPVVAAAAVAVALPDPEPEPDPDPEPEPEPAPIPEPTPEPVVVAPVVIPPPAPKPEPIPAPKTATGIYYSVQIGALGKDESDIRGSKLGQDVYIVMESGLYKHRIGQYPNVNDAISTKNDVFSKGVTDAFIVAYANGEKVGVAEARKMQSGGATTPKEVKKSTSYVKTKPVPSRIKKKATVFLAVQVGANISDADPIYEIAKYENAIGGEVYAIQGAPIRYYSGEFTDKNAAEKHLGKIKSMGLDKAFLIGVADGKRVKYEEALNFLGL